MVKIIDSVRNLNNCTEYLDISLLDNMSYYPIRLSKQCNIKNIYIGMRWKNNIYIGNMWWRALCGWNPLGFEGNMAYG